MSVRVRYMVIRSRPFDIIINYTDVVAEDQLQSSKEKGLGTYVHKTFTNTVCLLIANTREQQELEQLDQEKQQAIKVRRDVVWQSKANVYTF